jgi:hypothetical protein
MALLYRSREEIKAGDRVLFHGNTAEIEFVASADDPQQAFHVQEYGGGIMVFDPTAPSRTFIPADQLREYEDLEFISRADKQ